MNETEGNKPKQKLFAEAAPFVKNALIGPLKTISFMGYGEATTARK